MMQPARRLIAALALALCPALPAFADAEVWTNLETRIPLSRAQDPWPDFLRCIAGTRYGFRYPGVGLANLRVGPLWEVAPWLLIGLQTSTYAMQDQPGIFSQEMRAELEPNLHGRFGPLSINDRNRLEYRWRPTAASWRYRNQFRLTWHQPEWPVRPTAWGEVNLDLGLGQVAQTRAAIGLIHGLNDSTRLTVEYLFRSRPGPTSAWDHDHVLNVALFFAPHADDVIPADDTGP